MAVLLLLALSLRLGWVLSRPADDASIGLLPDQREYLSIARNVLSGRGMQFFDPRFNQRVFAFRMPGYPLFLAACAGNIRLARAAQAIIDTSTVLATYLLARVFIRGARRHTLALFAAALVAFNPYLIYFCGLLLSETLFTAMLIWGVLMLALGRPANGTGLSSALWLGGAALLAISPLVRPSALALPVGLGMMSVFMNRTGRTPYQTVHAASWAPRAARAGLALSCLMALGLLPWAVRNRIVLNHWVWLDTNSGLTLYDSYNPRATGASDQGFIRSMPGLGAMSEIGRSEVLRHRALDEAWMRKNQLWNLIKRRLARTWSPAPLSREFGRPSLRIIALSYSLPFFLLVLGGVALGRLPFSVKAFLLLPAIYFTGVHALTVGSLRYRIPVEPPLAVVAASLGGALGTRSSRPGRDLG